MPRDKGRGWSSAIHTETLKKAYEHGSVTHAGEQRAREGRGLDPLVDPSQHGVIRLVYNFLVPEEGQFLLKCGVAMPVKTDLDTTGSMGGNVEIAFVALPKVQNLLVQGPNAVLRRYHAEIATGIVQDEEDQFPYQVSQFEPDNEVDRQMGLLVPEKKGGDSTEDYQIGLFATAYLTKISISRYGLKGYYFIVGDEIGRDTLHRFHKSIPILEYVFGQSVYEKAFGPSYQSHNLPSTVEIGRKVLEDWHVFFLQVGNINYTTTWWKKILGRERVIILPQTEDLAEVQAVIIGLTEGVLDLQNVIEFLTSAGVNSGNAQRIVRAVANIPIGAQAKLQNFGRIPMAGARFKTRDDIWPMDEAASTKPDVLGEPSQPTPPPGSGINWKL